MKIEKLKKGMTFKNYKELCEFLEIKVTSGTAKESQFKELSRFCEWHKDGNKIIIDKKFRTPKNKEDGRMDRMTQEVMGNMLVEQICIYGKENSLSTFFDKNLLYEKCEMHNENYKFYRFKQDELSEREKIDIEVVRDFYNVSNSTFVSNIEKGAKWLKSKKLATMVDTYAIKCKNGGHRVVTKEELAVIQSYEAKVIEEELRTTRQSLFLNSTEDKNYYKFRNRVAEVIIEDIEKISQYRANELKKVLHAEVILGLSDMKYYYPCYEFIGDVNRIKKFYNKQFEKAKREKANERTIEKINESVDKKITNAKEGKSNKEYRTEENYKENMDNLINKNIKK